MRVLLVRSIAPNERFGLGPFFRIESLGLEYIGAALEAAGHTVGFVDLRFSDLARALSKFQPSLVGVAAAHTLDTSEALATAGRVKELCPGAFTLLGGHAAAVYPQPFFEPAVDAVCCEDGEQVVVDLVCALERGGPLGECAGLWLRREDRFVRTAVSPERVSLDRVPLPARHLVAPYRNQFLCLNQRPVYLVETTRGCPYRCSFCSIWRHVDRSYRCRGIEPVCADLASVGPHVFFADDLFFYPKRRSLELARALLARGIKKKWILVQTRTDLVARNPELLAEWRPLADSFDMFFGFESPTDQGLTGYSKDSGIDETREAIAVCRRLGFGVTGNFIVDPNWVEDDFRRLWDFIEQNRISRAGFTIMTPLPGTPLFDELRGRMIETDWARFDMNHILWEPRLGRARFFELYAECWRRTVLNARGGKKRWWKWILEVELRQIPMMARVLLQTQRMMDPASYLEETFPEEGAPLQAVPREGTGGLD